MKVIRDYWNHVEICKTSCDVMISSVLEHGNDNLCDQNCGSSRSETNEALLTMWGYFVRCYDEGLDMSL